MQCNSIPNLWCMITWVTVRDLTLCVTSILAPGKVTVRSILVHDVCTRNCDYRNTSRRNVLRTTSTTFCVFSFCLYKVLTDITTNLISSRIINTILRTKTTSGSATWQTNTGRSHSDDLSYHMRIRIRCRAALQQQAVQSLCVTRVCCLGEASSVTVLATSFLITSYVSGLHGRSVSWRSTSVSCDDLRGWA